MGENIVFVVKSRENVKMCFLPILPAVFHVFIFFFAACHNIFYSQSVVCLTMSRKKRTHDGIEITVDNVRDDEVDIILESKAKRSIVLRRISSAPQTRSYRRTHLVRQAVGNRHSQGKPKQKPKSAEHVEDTHSGNESHEEFIIVDEVGSESDGSSDIDCLVISDSICKYLSLITKVDFVRGLTLEVI